MQEKLNSEKQNYIVFNEHNFVVNVNAVLRRKNSMQRYERTVLCGRVNGEHLGKKIHLSGWVNKRRDHGGLIFIDLRDRSGIMQLVFNPDFSAHAHEQAHQLRSEYVIAVTGTVVERSEATINKEVATGRFELQVEMVTVLNKAKNLPFTLDEAAHVDEELRLTYRYLDLRRPEMHAKFVLRNNVIFALREFMHHEGFYDIETPILTKNTPEGAREFLVPSRTHKHSFYALPQSPQLYKQLLMAGGMERYYQVARCFRDEDLRADRQPEFTQLDIEMSFITEADIQDVIERLIAHVWKKTLNIDVKVPFNRMTYDTAFSQYGSDKPDLRFALPIVDMTQAFMSTQLSFLRAILDKQGKVGALCVQKAFTRSELDAWVNKAQKLEAKGLLWIRMKEDGTLDSPVAKFLAPDFLQTIKQYIPEFGPQSTLFIVAGKYTQAWTVLGRLRLELGKELNMINWSEFNFSWVIDFPLFEQDETTKAWNAVHHPFTSPQEGWQHLEPSQMKARAYDIILNGIELGGGSIRIHDAQIQDKVFDLLGLSKEQVQNKFGFLLEAQEFGFPPHGGIALGLDRLIMLMCNATSIREVIAFPKTQSGFDPLMSAPTKVQESDLQEYGLSFMPEKKK